ncbi:MULTISPECIES: hypothetical protein [unclassified Solibacillus]|uniref:hypothetical protein n=1 Tax=unclassified Solibacillus TaxID=2637870 RepID=UPI0030F550B5
MNKKGFIIYLSICLVFFLMMLVSACTDEILEIEEGNAFTWQKYMNEEEFNKLEEGMSYLEVVRVTGGAGEEIDNGVFEWNDEFLMTQAYRLQFKEDGLVQKEIVERKGNSSR